MAVGFMNVGPERKRRKLRNGSNGYITVNGIREGVHRYSYILANGPIPEGLFVLHKCDVPKCVNPDHLFLGSQADNMRDCSVKGRASGGQPSGVSNSNAKLTPLKAAVIRFLYANGERQCDLAKQFGVTSRIIKLVRTMELWKDSGHGYIRRPARA